MRQQAEAASAEELAMRMQEAKQWHGVAEELATEHRDEAVVRVLGHARAVRLTAGLASWRAATTSSSSSSSSSGPRAAVPASPQIAELAALSGGFGDDAGLASPAFDLTGLDLASPAGPSTPGSLMD